MAVLSGEVNGSNGQPLENVTVRVRDGAAWGETQVQPDGSYAMAINGGDIQTVRFELDGYLPVERRVNVPIRDYTALPDVTMTAYDTKVTTIDLVSGATQPQVASGSVVSDGDGERQATMIFPTGVSASMALPDGTVAPLPVLDVRATEYTVGATGPEAMPAQLPASSAYTYAVEFSVDQAVGAGATEVRFDKPVATYVDNFLSMPIGVTVPSGYYDFAEQRWIASEDGRVIKIVGISNGSADVDADGDGQADTSTALQELGMTAEELQELADLYPQGKSLWRVPVTHFTPYDYNWPSQPPRDAVGPGGEPLGSSPEDDNCTIKGSIIECESQVLGESVEVTGTPFSLGYRSDRVPGRRSGLDFPITGANPPASLKRANLEIVIAGQSVTESFGPSPNQTYSFLWDRKDLFGRIIQGGQQVTARLSYVYDGSLYCRPAGSVRSFGRFCSEPLAGEILTRDEFVLTREWRENVPATKITNWDARGQGLGGWTLDVHHAFDPGTSVVYLGSGERQSSRLASGTTIDRAFPHGAALNGPQGLDVGPDGSIYIADRVNDRIRKVAPDGTITTVAGNGTKGFGGDGGPAIAARLSSPYDVVVSEDGSIYVADTGNNRIRRIAPSGDISTFAGTGTAGFEGNGGPAQDAKLSSPRGLALDTAGRLYISDTSNNRIRRVNSDGTIQTFAGGFNGCCQAQLLEPVGLAFLPGGELLVADAGYHRVWKIHADGSIASPQFAGTGKTSGTWNDGALAQLSPIERPVGVDVAADGTAYITYHGQLVRVAPDGRMYRVSGSPRAPYNEGAAATSSRAFIYNGDVAVGPGGSIYVAADSSARVRRVDSTGRMTTVAGTGDHSYYGDGGSAGNGPMQEAVDIAVGPDGSRYVSDEEEHAVFRVSKGVVTKFAGTGWCDYTGDGGPAIDATLCFPGALDVAADGSLYVADRSNNVVRKISSDGIISTVAGNGNWGFEGDGVPATETALSWIAGIAVDDRGALIISDQGNYRIRQVDPGSGLITTVAGSGTSGYSGDGGPATDAQLGGIKGIDVSRDGSIYVADDYRLRRINPSGIIETFAGSGCCGTSGDGGPATDAKLDPSEVALGADGSVYASDGDRVRVITADGTITAAAGGVCCADGDGGLATEADLDLVEGLGASHDGTLYIADGRAVVRRVGTPPPSFVTGEQIVPSKDGSQVFVFDGRGRHLRTHDALTNVVLYRFEYDPTGLLAAVTDVDENTTTIERNDAGTPTAIVSPYGQRTLLAVDQNGYLSSITDPVGNSVLTTHSASGLLASFTDENGNAHAFSFSEVGRLTVDDPPGPALTSLSRTGTQRDYTVSVSTAGGRTTTYRVVKNSDGGGRRVVTYPNGTTSTAVTTADARSITLTQPDGTVVESTLGPDPRWGMKSPILNKMIVTTPAGKKVTSTATRTITLDDPANLMSLSTQVDAITSNEKTFTKAFDADARTITTTSPEGRVGTVNLDAKGHVASVEAPGVAAVGFNYDTRGRLMGTTQGSGTQQRSSTITYDSNGFVGSVGDSLHTTSFTNDELGRVASTALPDNSSIGFGYDDGGNLTSLSPPGRSAHGFGHTSGDLLESYVPPSVAGESHATGYTYNAEDQPTAINLPGPRSIALAYDRAGRLDTTTISRGAIDYGYTASQLSSISTPDGPTLAYGYDGSLLTSVDYSGALTGSIAYGYDADLRVSSRTVNDGAATNFTYDKDGLVKTAGELGLTWNAATGMLSSTALGNVATSHGYNSFAELENSSASYSGSGLYSASYERDQLGRITKMSESIGGAPSIYEYVYDARGRLTDVTKDGAAWRHYEYDANGNRTSASEDGGAAVTGTYDAQDRLTSYGSTTYSHNAMGQRISKTIDSDVTTYDYDELGNLMKVVLPTKTLTYVVDGLGRRVAKTVDGTTTNRYLYGQGILPIAELNSDGTVKSQFVYASKRHVPDFMIKNGVTYRFVTDQVGSVRMAVNTTDGTIAQQIDYDPFGNVISDTNPGFQPFGFAGGLYDPETGLVRFGGRDYDAEIGRWTAKDPIGFSGGDPNLYAYVYSDPVNLIDPTGELAFIPIIVGAWAVIEVGLSIADAINTASTLADVCASASEKFTTGGLFILGLALPGGGATFGDDAARAALRTLDDLPANAHLLNDFDEVASHLSRYHGIDPRLASKRLHEIKPQSGRGGAANVIFDRTGGVWDPNTGEYLGSLTQGGAGSRP
ncbi:MAG: hypothetical protein M3N53_08820 [Actinomycetota bacterium]|nr:hypothetical protein [Actinomycetota bacterium]